MGIPIEEILQELLHLKLDLGEISYTLSDQSFYVRVLRMPPDLVELANAVSRKLALLENSRVHKIHALYRILKEVATPTLTSDMLNSNDLYTDEKLNTLIEHYFLRSCVQESELRLETERMAASWKDLDTFSAKQRYPYRFLSIHTIICFFA